MRVTSGLVKGHKLFSPIGTDTRPTSDKIKQSLFNVINEDIIGSKFLDLFAGTGAIGIEALSRGAEFCVFVDSSRIAADCIKKNIKHTKMEQKSLVMMTNAKRAIENIAQKGEKFDIIFMDPPYKNAGDMESLTKLIKQFEILKTDGYIIGEHGQELDISRFSGIELLKEKKYGKMTIISFWRPE